MTENNNTDTEKTPPERNLNEGEPVLLYPNDKSGIKTYFQEQIGIVVHGGDVSGRNDIVPIVMTDTGKTYRIRAKNWEQADVGHTQSAEFLSKPLEEKENQERKYNEAVENVKESEDFDVDLD